MLSDHFDFLEFQIILRYKIDDFPKKSKNQKLDEFVMIDHKITTMR